MKISSNTIDKLKSLIDEAHEAGADAEESSELSSALDGILATEIETALAPLEAKITSNLQQLMNPIQVTQVERAPGTTVARALRAFAVCGGDRKEAAIWAKAKWGDDEFAIKTLTEGSAAGGGFLVSGDAAGEIIELLRPRSILRAAGPVIMGMNSDSKPIPRIAGGATASYIGENVSQNASDVTFDQLVLRIKKLRATVAISNELEDDADESANQLVITDIVSAMAITEDVKFLRGDGTNQTPVGLLNWAGTTTDSAAPDDGTDPTLAEVREDIATAQDELNDANSRMIKSVWMMAPKTVTYMKWNLTDGNNNLVFKDELSKGELDGFPVFVSNNIPTDLGSNTRGESEIYFVDMADVVIGDRKVIEFTISDSASFTDSSGSTVSAFDNDLLVIRAISRHDLIVRHPGSVHVTTGVPYRTS